MPLSKILIWSIPLLIFCVMVFMLLPTIEHPVWSIFNWVPQWFRLNRFDFGEVSKDMLWLMLALGFLLNGSVNQLIKIK